MRLTQEQVDTMATAFGDELQKIAASKKEAGSVPWVPVAAGALGMHLLTQAERDRRMGRQIRAQNQGTMY